MSVTSGDIGAIYINDKFYGYVDELNNPGGGLLLNLVLLVLIGLFKRAT